MSALGTSTLRRTLSAPISSTRVSTSPFKQTAFDPPSASVGDERARNRHEEGTHTCVVRPYDSRRVAGGGVPSQGGDPLRHGPKRGPRPGSQARALRLVRDRAPGEEAGEGEDGGARDCVHARDQALSDAGAGDCDRPREERKPGQGPG